MLHSNYPIDILDEQGNVIGSKPRIELDKHHDRYASANILLITPRGELIVQTIPPNETLPNIYVGRLGVLATVRWSGESSLAAAQRCMARELFIDDMKLTKLGEKMHDLPDGRREWLAAFYGIAEMPSNFSPVDIESLVVITPKQLDALAASEKPLDTIAVNLLAIWQTYRHKLPL